jgi:hypothetical protein
MHKIEKKPGEWWPVVGGKQEKSRRPEVGWGVAD